MWNVIATLICWTPSTRRLSMKSRMTRVSGAEKAAEPWYVADDFEPDEPPQQPQW